MKPPSRREFIKLASLGAGSLSLADVPASDAGGRVIEPLLPRNPVLGDASWSGAPEQEPGEKSHSTLPLNGPWWVSALPLTLEGPKGYQQLQQEKAERWAAEVPGDVHLDLMRAGRMEDPDKSDNARARCRWPENHSWWYRTDFSVDGDFLNCLRQELIFEGIDLFGQIFINGQLVGESKNAFLPLRIDAKPWLKTGINELVVRVTSGLELMPKPTFVGKYADFYLREVKIDPLYSNRSWDQTHPLRKAVYSVWGNDDNDPLPNIGIWRGVRLEGRDGIVIDHICLDTSLVGDRVYVTGWIRLENLHPWSEKECVLMLSLKSPQGHVINQHRRLMAPIGRFSVPCSIEVSNPQLWWPNGFGDQPLYELTVRVMSVIDETATIETDKAKQMLGLRTLELDRSPLPEGSRFAVKVNGQRIFCKGANWYPPDLIAARIDITLYEKYIEAARNAHFTMIRLWGGGYYEHDAFYAACDRAGILVWQDFMFSDGEHPDQAADFLDSIREEAKAVVKRLRHHACLALWCGSNENPFSMTLVWKSDPRRPNQIGGVRTYNWVLPDVCREYDPGRTYWPSSPFGGTNPNSELSGDTHGYEKASDTRSRFVSEAYCSIGPPNFASLKEYLKPEEMSLDSAAWKVHDNATNIQTIPDGIRARYGDPTALSLRDYLLYGQMSQGEVLADGLEAMRFRKNDATDDCQGFLFWAFNEVWPGATWSIIDHYLRRKASYYAFKRAAKPVKILSRPRGRELVTRVINDTRNAYTAVVSHGWMRLDGRARELQSRRVRIAPNSKLQVAATPLPKPGERNPHEWLYAAELRGNSVNDQHVWLLAPYPELTLSTPAISMAVANGIVEVISPVFCRGVHADDGGEGILSDNYFDLLPGIAQRITSSARLLPSPNSFKPVLPVHSSV